MAAGRRRHVVLLFSVGAAIASTYGFATALTLVICPSLILVPRRQSTRARLCQVTSVADPTVFAAFGEGNRENGTKGLRQKSPDLSAKVKRTIGWVNENILKNTSKIRYDVVAPHLAALPSEQALRILRGVQERADNMFDATHFVRVGALTQLISKLERDAANAINKTEEGAAGDLARYKEQELDLKVSRVIDGINRASILETPLRYDKVAEYLMALPPASALRILKRLRESKSNVTDPTHYVQVACLSYLGGRRRAGVGGNDAASAAGNSTQPLDGKVYYRMIWLNENGGLKAPIRLNKVMKGLSALPVKTSLAILKRLEQSATQIQDPSRWIMRAALDALTAELGAAEGGGATFAAQRAKSDLDDRVKRHIHWINSNANLKAPIRCSKVQKPLAAIPVQRALRIVEDTRKKPNTRDPTNVVLIRALMERVTQLRESLQRGIES